MIPNTDTLSKVVITARDVGVTVERKAEAALRLVSCPSASDLDLDVLLGDQNRDIRNVLVEHDARMEAMQSRG